MQTRVHLIITGKVQGICFRAYTEQEAIRLGLKGWVKNCPDGSVEIIAEGEEKKVEELIRWCQHGPSRAQVTEVKIKKEKFENEFFDFQIR